MINTIKHAINTSSHEIGVTSHNIANAGTAGFKRSSAFFEDLFLKQGEIYGPIVGSGALVQGSRVNHSPTALKQTGVSSDLAINGHGMFVLKTPRSEEQPTFTRNGSFQLDNNGFLTTMDGQHVLSKNLTSIQIEYEKAGIPLSEFNVRPDGLVTAAYGVASPEPIDQLGIAYFDNPEALRQLGNGGYIAGEEASLFGIFRPGENGTGEVRSGHLEMANVDIVKELISLLKGQQAFSAASKAIQADNDMVSRFTR